VPQLALCDVESLLKNLLQAIQIRALRIGQQGQKFQNILSGISVPVVTSLNRSRDKIFEMPFKIKDLQKTGFRLPEQKRGLGAGLPTSTGGHLVLKRY
jgi:hypothetical protein